MSRVLIAYRTRYGTVRRCAEALRAGIRAEVALVDLKEDGRPPLDAFDLVLIGGSIYAGRVQREVPAFAERCREQLLAKPVGLFICCLYEGERAAAELETAFPSWLNAHAFSRRVLGGELIPGRLRALDRLLIKAMKADGAEVHRLQDGQIEALCADVNARV